jgi:hypothetical protein
MKANRGHMNLENSSRQQDGVKFFWSSYPKTLIVSISSISLYGNKEIQEKP